MAASMITKGAIRFLITIMIIGSCLSGQEAPGANPGSTSPGIGKEPLVLTYVANSGVLAASGNFKVLVDALFDKPNPEYRPPAPEVLEKIIKGPALRSTWLWSISGFPWSPIAPASFRRSSSRATLP